MKFVKIEVWFFFHPTVCSVAPFLYQIWDMLKHVDYGHINNDFYKAALFFCQCWKNKNIVHNIQLL